MQAEYRRDPFAWAYSQYYFGKQVNVVKLAKVARAYMDDRQYQQLEDQCRITQNIAVSSRLLSRRTKEKYRDRMLRVGRESFYLFPCDSIPPEVFFRIKPRDGIYIYQINVDNL